MEFSTLPSENEPSMSQNHAPQHENPQPEGDQTPQPKWEVLSSIDRRVAGVLVEKAKTTPDAYPLSLNALCNGCNQKSNRTPLMQLDPETVEESLDRLRQKGAVFAVQGSGRVAKYRHNMYEWLGVSKQEIAVIAELLLRGAQSQGELRARAARMEPIAGLAELKPIVQSLKERGLVVSLTPEGRGHILTHNLYQPRELEKLRATHSQDAPPPANTPTPVTQSPTPTPTISTAPPIQSNAIQDNTIQDNAIKDDVNTLHRENEDLRTRVTDLNSQVADLTDRIEQTERSLRSLRDSLGG